MSVDGKDPSEKDVCVITLHCVAQEYVGNSFKDEISWSTADMKEVMKDKYGCVSDLGHYYEDDKSGGNLMLCSNANK